MSTTLPEIEPKKLSSKVDSLLLQTNTAIMNKTGWELLPQKPMEQYQQQRPTLMTTTETSLQ
jgi:hypothetical protein